MAFAGKKDTSVKPAVSNVPKPMRAIARPKLSKSKGAKASGIDIFITKAMVWSNWCTVGLNSVANSQLPPQSHDQNSKPLAKHNVKVAKVQQMLEKVSASGSQMLRHLVSARHHFLAVAARVLTTILNSSSRVKGSVLQE